MEGMPIRNQVTSSEKAPISSLRDAAFLAMAGSESKDVLESAAELKTYPAGSMIFGQGDPSDSVVFVRSGAVRIYVDPPEGHRIELRTLGPGEIFGELGVVGGQRRTASAQAATDVDVWAVDHGTFNAVYRSDPRVAVEIAKVMAPYVLADEETGSVTVAELRERIAASLVDMSEAATIVTVPELVRRTGAQLSNVIQVLEHFEAGGAVGIGSEGVEILDRDALDAFAGG